MSNGKALTTGKKKGEAPTKGEWIELIGLFNEGVSFRDDINPDAIRAHLGAKSLSHKALRKLFSMSPQQAIDLLSGKGKLADELLDFVGTITIPAITTNFVARDKFIVNTERNDLLRICFLGNNFKKWFLGKIEEPTGETILHCYELKNSSVDIRIIRELGGEDMAKTALAMLFAFMERHENGENGILTRGRVKKFYIEDDRQVLRSVSALNIDYGWHLYAESIVYPSEWSAGGHVFSGSKR